MSNVDVFAFPFRFDPAGQPVKVVQGSDADMAQKINGLLRTELDELPLAPLFGMDDPTFAEFSAGELVAAASIFYPEITIVAVSEDVIDDGRFAIEVEFAATGEGVGSAFA
jgi:hypothetical protein